MTTNFRQAFKDLGGEIRDKATYVKACATAFAAGAIANACPNCEVNDTEEYISPCSRHTKVIARLGEMQGAEVEEREITITFDVDAMRASLRESLSKIPKYTPDPEIQARFDRLFRERNT